MLLPTQGQALPILYTLTSHRAVPTARLYGWLSYLMPNGIISLLVKIHALIARLFEKKMITLQRTTNLNKHIHDHEKKDAGFALPYIRDLAGRNGGGN